MTSVARICSVEWCGRPLTAKGYCATHYTRQREGRPMDTPIRSQVTNRECALPGCDGGFSARGLCRLHYALKKRYGLDTLDLVELLADAECAICGSTEQIHIDHDHACCPGMKSCGECVRGVLCGHCNRGLGNFRDDSGLLDRAIIYLSRT